ncbi:unnamed protein product [Calypogeia fissa]
MSMDFHNQCRYFLFFHERILQSLLEDPTFSLNYWNWDNPYTIGKGSKDGECLAQGDNFPSDFSDPSGTTYDDLRSQNAKGFGRFHFPDFYYVPGVPAVSQPNYTATEEPIFKVI